MENESRWKINVSIMEEGDIYFFYKPKKGVDEPKSINDVSRFYFVLQANDGSPPRYIIMGNKKMPNLNDGDKTAWGFIQIVGGRGFEVTRNQENRVKGASRPAGEGIYAIVTHRTHTHLLFALELPQKPGEVQQSFNIRKEADYIMMQRAAYIGPRYIDLPFSNFSPVKDSKLLNMNGTQLLLIGVGPDIARIGISADTERETIDTSDVINKLRVDVKRHPITSLISGSWG